MLPHRYAHRDRQTEMVRRVGYRFRIRSPRNKSGSFTLIDNDKISLETIVADIGNIEG